MDDSRNICNEVIKSYEEEIKAIPTNFHEKKVTCKTFITISKHKKLKQIHFDNIN